MYVYVESKLIQFSRLYYSHEYVQILLLLPPANISSTKDENKNENKKLNYLKATGIWTGKTM